MGEDSCIKSVLIFLEDFTFKSILPNSPINLIIYGKGCEAKSIWLLVRHGSRNPGKKDIKKFTKNAEVLKKKIVENNIESGAFCENDLNIFQSWSFNLTSGNIQVF